MIPRWIKDVWAKRKIKHIMTVGPSQEFHAHGVTITNDTDNNVIKIWAESFPDKRKDDRREQC